ncbi:MAG: ComEC/Rec2 family competence protein [Acidimicrobiia bacterium]
MTDVMVVVLAVAVWAGAWWAAPVPVWPAALAAGLCLLSARPLGLVVAAALLAAGLASTAWAGLSPPRPAPLAGWATLVRAPEAVPGGVRVEVRLGGRHLDAWARGPAGAELAHRAPGQRGELAGSVRPLGPMARRHLAPRHVAGRLEVAEVGGWRPAPPAHRVANRIRRVLERGARPLEPDDRSLLLGVVLGDDADRSPTLDERFRAAGLSHLLAVSGQNVAFVLALAGPLLRRLGLRSRWAVTLALLAFFALLTGWEPSVVRAGAMAAIACTSWAAGRPASSLRLLALAVAASVLLDPLLVRSVGFQLSVGATLGIALLARPLASRLRGPAWLREVVAVTLAAQVGVLPVAVPVFGGVPVASLPANVLAAPVAAPLTTWGLVAGLLAGRLGPPADRLLHRPTAVLTGWLDGVAGWAAGLPLGTVGARTAAGIGAGAVLLASLRWSWRWVRTGSTSRRGPS